MDFSARHICVRTAAIGRPTLGQDQKYPCRRVQRVTKHVCADSRIGRPTLGPWVQPLIALFYDTRHISHIHIYNYIFRYIIFTSTSHLNKSTKIHLIWHPEHITLMSPLKGEDQRKKRTRGTPTCSSHSRGRP